MPWVNFQIRIGGAPRTVSALRLKATPLIITILAASLLLGAAQVSGLDKPTDRAAALVAWISQQTARRPWWPETRSAESG